VDTLSSLKPSRLVSVWTGFAEAQQPVLRAYPEVLFAVFEDGENGVVRQDAGGAVGSDAGGADPNQSGAASPAVGGPCSQTASTVFFPPCRC